MLSYEYIYNILSLLVRVHDKLNTVQFIMHVSYGYVTSLTLLVYSYRTHTAVSLTILYKLYYIALSRIQTKDYEFYL